MPVRTFNTKYGNEIEYVEGYRDKHNTVSADQAFERFTYNEYDNIMGFRGFLRDAFEYALLMDYIDSLDIDMNRNRALDIGGAEGAMSRFLKLEGRAEISKCIDIKNLENELTNKTFIRYAKFLKSLAKVRGLSDYLKHTLIHHGVKDYGYVPGKGSSLWNIDLERTPRLDEFIHGDFHQHDFEYSFGLITAFLCLEYFDIELTFERVSSLLEKGGIFAFLVNYWWWPVNSTVIVGDFPYAAQRLERDDLKSYYEQEYPELVDDVLQRYDYFHKTDRKPVLNDYIERAHEHDLRLAGAQRLFPQSTTHPKTPVPPVELVKQGHLTSTLRDIHEFRTDVSLADLQTAYVQCVFIKE